MARALVPLADGVEEMEAVIIIDTLRRANWSVTAAAVASPTVTGSRGIRLVPDRLWGDVDGESFEVLALPGGAAGTDALCSDPRVLQTVRSFEASSRLVGAICAGPLVLQAAGVLRDRRLTCHPAVRDRLTDPSRWVSERVVVDRGVVTSQGPGTAIEFALTLIEVRDGRAARQAVSAGLIV